MMNRKNRTQQRHEESYQQKKDRQYKKYLGLNQKKLGSSQQPSDVDLYIPDQYLMFAEAESEALQQEPNLHFETTYQKLLGLLLFSTALVSLIPVQKVEAVPVRGHSRNPAKVSGALTRILNTPQLVQKNVTHVVHQALINLANKSQPEKKIKNKDIALSGLFKRNKQKNDKDSSNLKKLDFSNESETYMQFSLTTGEVREGSHCAIKITPDKFELLPNQNREVNFELPDCLKGEKWSAGIYIEGRPSKGGPDGLAYEAQFINNPSATEYTCSKQSDNRLFTDYCYYLLFPGSPHPDINIETDPDNIRIKSAPKPHDGFYTFFNDATDAFYSMSFGEGYSKECSTLRRGALQPKSKDNFSTQEMKYYCYTNPTSCRITVYMDKECVSHPIGILTLDINQGIKSIQVYTYQGDYPLYRLSYKNATSGRGENIHVTNAVNYYLLNSADISFNININSSCQLTGGLWSPNPPRPLLFMVDTWKELNKDPSSCEVIIYATKKTKQGFFCGPGLVIFY